MSESFLSKNNYSSMGVQVPVYSNNLYGVGGIQPYDRKIAENNL